MTYHTKCEKLDCLRAKFQPKKFLQDMQLNNKSVGVVLLVMIIFSSLMYMVQINAMAAKSYKIKELENQVRLLEDSNKKVEVQITELRSMNNLEDRLAQIEMVPVGHVDYIKAPEADVAVNR